MCCWGARAGQLADSEHYCCYRTHAAPLAGQFGTRLQGGKDAASPRYIFTRIATLTRHLFNEADDRLLAYLNDEGQSIEPEWCVCLPLSHHGSPPRQQHRALTHAPSPVHLALITTTSPPSPPNR